MASQTTAEAPGARRGATRAPLPPGARRTPSGWTTRRWLTAGIAVALTVLAGLGVLGGWTLAHTSSLTSDLVDRSSPALIWSVRLESSLINQESGVRGYGLSGQRDFLQPYHQGLADEKTAVAELRTLSRHDPASRADLENVLTAARHWQDQLARPIADASSPAEARHLATSRADEGKSDFDAVRRAAAVQQTRLKNHRTTAHRKLHRATVLRDWVFALIAAIILALAALVVEALRRGVTLPLERLSEDARLVAEGDFEHRITATGPADLRELAADVEAMRQRLAAELEYSDRARDRLDAQATDLRRSNAELEQFAYVASHDLQEPLRKVASFCQLLERRYAAQLDDRAKQYISFAVDGANRMQTLINDLLAFSRVGRVHKGHGVVDLAAVHAATMDALSVSVEETGAEVTHDPLPEVNGDATQLGMLWQNLISNAVKFRDPERPPRVRVEAHRTDGWWEFAVSDNGIGIAEEYAERVFVIFQRLHTKDAYPGNGIGLAMCKKIVEFHGGTIRVDPAHSPGTRIVFTLPAAPEPEASGDSAESGAESGAEGEAGAGGTETGSATV
jgi:signal transduction histidine kinase